MIVLVKDLFYPGEKKNMVCMSVRAEKMRSVKKLRNVLKNRNEKHG